MTAILRFSAFNSLLILAALLTGCSDQQVAQDPTQPLPKAGEKLALGTSAPITTSIDGAPIVEKEPTEPAASEKPKVNKEATADPPKPDRKIIPPTIAKTGPYPKAVAEELEYRFGRMPLGGESEYAFTIRNEGEADLKLVAGKSTCQCTKFDLTKSTLKPGESCELIVRWKLQQVNLQFQHGGPVYTNDPERAVLHYAVSGAVDNAIHVTPNSIWEMNAVPYGQEGTYEGYISSTIYDHFELESVSSESGKLQIDVEEVSPEAAADSEMLSGYRITVRLPADYPPGIVEDKLTFKPDKVDKAAQIGFKAIKEGPVAIVAAKGGIWVGGENKLRLGRFAMRSGKKAQLILAVNDAELPEEGFQVTDVESKPRYLKTKLEKMSSVKQGVSRYSLEIEVPPGSPRASYPGTKPARMKIKTNHPSHEFIEVQLSFKTF